MIIMFGLYNHLPEYKTDMVLLCEKLENDLT